MHGGEQERKRRASTENVPGIIGLGRAIELAQQEMGGEAERLAYLRDKLAKGLLERIDHAREGICVSTGSACSSSSLEPSHILLALGLPP